MRFAVLDDEEGYAGSFDWSDLPSDVTVDVLGRMPADRAQLVGQLVGHELVLAMRERTAFPAAVIRSLPSLRLLVTTGMQNPSIDLPAATEAGVVVSGTPAAGEGPAEQTWALLLGLVRHVAREDAAVRQGGWGSTVGKGLKGRTIGVIGLGKIGSRVARVARALDMSVIAWSPHLTDDRALEHGARRVGLDVLLADSDVVSLHIRLSDSTRRMIGAHELSRMRPHAVLVNTSRGALVDEEALVQALRNRRIGGAALDVFDSEPLPPGHPLTTLDNTLLAPHRGYVTEENFAAYYAGAAHAVRAFVEGTPVRVLNPDVLGPSPGPGRA
jgi:phosphoglycerate dehydrogenase-like enzyme